MTEPEPDDGGIIGFFRKIKKNRNYNPELFNAMLTHLQNTTRGDGYSNINFMLDLNLYIKGKDTGLTEAEVDALSELM